MNTITYSQRYLPHELNTKFYTVKLYRTGVGVSFVLNSGFMSEFSSFPLFPQAVIVNNNAKVSTPQIIFS